jgi:hypothetical protein
MEAWMGKALKWVFGFLILAFIGIQFVPVERTNPPVTGELAAPDPVMEVFRGSCYDCHSNETVWPWYSRVAPLSWRLADHVEDGRRHLNFSEWESLSEEDRDDLRGEIWEEVEEGNMPLSDYLRMHPEAVMTDSQRDVLRRWLEGRPQEFPDWN